MKLQVWDTSIFDLNEYGGLEFEIAQHYSDANGFHYIAWCEELGIAISYKNKEDFDTELNDEIVAINMIYSDKDDSELCGDAIKVKQFGIDCFTKYKK